MLNKQYRELFQFAARNGAINAENAVKVLASEEGHMEEIEGLLKMRDNFAALEDKIMAKKEELTLLDYILLYAGAVVSRNMINKNILTQQSMLNAYDNELLPQLKEVTETLDADKRDTLIEEFFCNEKI